MFFYYITILLIPFGNHPLISYNVGGVTPIKVFGGLSLLAAVMEILSKRERGPQFRTRISKYFMWLVAIFFISATVNGGSVHSEALLRFVSIIIFFITTLALVNSRERFVRSMWLLIICMDVAAVYMFREYSLYGAKYDNFRPSGILGDPNYTALNLLTVIPIAFFLFKDSIEKKGRIIAAGSLCLYLGALGLSQSRGGFLGFGMELVLLLIILKFRIKPLIFLGIVTAVVVSFLPVDIMSRFNPEASGVKKSTESRYELFVSGVRMLKGNPLIGIGPGNFKQYSDRYNDMVSAKQIAHNSYLELAAELGCLGFSLYLLIAWETIKNLRMMRMSNIEDPELKAMITGLGVGVIGYLVSATFLSAEFEKIIWFLIFTSAAATKFVAVSANDKKPAFTAD